MASGLTWLKLKVEAHEHPKVEALDDGAFRMWTRIICLARRSSVPGKVFVTPVKGVNPVALAAGARCRRPELGEAMLAEIVSVGLVEVDQHGVITVHDFEEHQRLPPSKTREGKKKQKAIERDRQKVNLSPPRRPDVAPGSGTVSPRNGQGEVEGEGEVEEEKNTHTLAVAGDMEKAEVGKALHQLVTESGARYLEIYRREFEGNGADAGVRYTGSDPDDAERFELLALRCPDVDEFRERVRRFFAKPWTAKRASVSLLVKQFDEMAFAEPEALA